jgi:hypothetical protein
LVNVKGLLYLFIFKCICLLCLFVCLYLCMWVEVFFLRFLSHNSGRNIRFIIYVFITIKFSLRVCINWLSLKSHVSLLSFKIYVLFVYIYVQRKDSLNTYCLKNFSHVTKTYVIITCVKAFKVKWYVKVNKRCFEFGVDESSLSESVFFSGYVNIYCVKNFTFWQRSI